MKPVKVPSDPRTEEAEREGEGVTEEEYQPLNEIAELLNYCIRRLTVPMMKFRDEDIKAVHSKLLEAAAKLDELIEE